MTGLTFLQGCLLVALSLIVGAQGASATGAVSGMQPQVELHRSIVNGARLLPSEPLDDWFLKKMLLPQRLKHLKLGSDLQELTDSTVSQPDAPV